MSVPILNPSKELNLEFGIDFSPLIQTMKSNFAIIWQTISKQDQDIQTLKSQVSIQQRSIKSRADSRTSQRKISKNFQLNFSETSFQPKEGEKKEIYQNSSKVILKDKIVQGSNKRSGSAVNLNANAIANESETINVVNATKQANPEAIIEKNNTTKIKLEKIQSVANKYQDGLQNQDRLQNQNALLDKQIVEASDFLEHIVTTTPKLMESKILQLSERMQKVELISLKQSSNFGKKMNQLYLQLERTQQILNKRESQMKKQDIIIEKFRTELSEYKLKKQSQMMRMSSLNTNSSNANSNSNSNSNSNKQFNEFLLQKIQQINNYLPEFVTKPDFSSFQDQIKIDIKRLDRKSADFVTNDEFSGLMNVLTRKKKDPAMQIIKKDKKKNEQQKSPEISEIELIDDSAALQLRLMLVENKAQCINQELNSFKSAQQIKIDRISNVGTQSQIKIDQLNNKHEMSLHKVLQHEAFMRTMNQSYNEKLKQIVSQIVETQESIEKLSSQMKFFSFTKSEASMGSVSPTVHSSGNFESGKMIDLQNQVSTIKKKLNKITLKVQGSKEQLLIAREDFMKECDSLKAVLEKKCDWESLKKGLNYFEDRLKEVGVYLENIEKNISMQQQNGESTAAKKGWTCLCCDKDIKQYEGKLGQAKFTSVFPVRYESPRIGGYYKQREVTKQYAQLFLNKNTRKLSQSNTKQREEQN